MSKDPIPSCAQPWEASIRQTATTAMNLRRNLLADFAKPPLSVLIRYDGFKKIFLLEVRPQGGGEIQFAVSDLPQQEITDPLFPAGSDQKFRIGKARGFEVGGE